jgi:hypothetical protein
VVNVAEASVVDVEASVEAFAVDVEAPAEAYAVEIMVANNLNGEKNVYNY